MLTYLKPLETVFKASHALLAKDGNTSGRGRTNAGNNATPARELL